MMWGAFYDCPVTKALEAGDIEANPVALDTTFNLAVAQGFILSAWAVRMLCAPPL